MSKKSIFKTLLVLVTLLVVGIAVTQSWIAVGQYNSDDAKAPFSITLAALTGIVGVCLVLMTVIVFREAKDDSETQTGEEEEGLLLQAHTERSDAPSESIKERYWR